MAEIQPTTNAETEIKAAPAAPENNPVEPPSEETNSNVNNTKGRRSSGKPKISRIMKDVQEGEALLKEMGHEIDGPDEGRRRTRSSTRGGGPPPPPTPPPVKRQRRSGSSSTAKSPAEKPATPTNTNTGSNQNRGRGRPKKDADADEVQDEDKHEEMETDNVSTDAAAVKVKENNSEAKEAIKTTPPPPPPVTKNVKETTPTERVNTEAATANKNDSQPEKKVSKSDSNTADRQETVNKPAPPVSGNNANNKADSPRKETNELRKEVKEAKEVQPTVISVPSSTPPAAAAPAPKPVTPASAPAPPEVKASPMSSKLEDTITIQSKAAVEHAKDTPITSSNSLSSSSPLKCEKESAHQPQPNSISAEPQLQQPANADKPQ